MTRFAISSRLRNSAGIALAVAAAGLAFAQPAAAEDQTVSMEGIAYVPSTVTIEVGDTVTWVGNDGAVPHTVTSTTGEFDSGADPADWLMQDDTFSVTFDEAGTFDYFCIVHPAQMTGQVIVEEQTAPTEEPTEAPTEEPTEAPTEEPTEAPTEEPTEAPTEVPTEAPTEEPTEAPTEVPTEEPTVAPTEEPTEAPTVAPTTAPTVAPTTVAPTPPSVGSGNAGSSGPSIWIPLGAALIAVAGGVAFIARRRSLV